MCFGAKSSVIVAFPFPAELPACRQPVMEDAGNVLFWEVEEALRVSVRKRHREENEHCWRQKESSDVQGKLGLSI